MAPKKNERNEQLFAMKQQNPQIPYTEIARQFGISTSRAREIHLTACRVRRVQPTRVPE